MPFFDRIGALRVHLFRLAIAIIAMMVVAFVNKSGRDYFSTGVWIGRVGEEDSVQYATYIHTNETFA